MPNKINFNNALKSALKDQESINNFHDQLKQGQNEIYQKNTKETKSFDEKWIDTLESYLPSINNIISNPKSSLAREKELVLVERVRKVDSHTINHGGDYTNNSIVFQTVGNSLSWYYATSKGSSYGQLTQADDWKRLGYEYDFINTGNKYRVGELVLYNNELYIIVNIGYHVSISDTRYFKKSVERGNYLSNITYNHADIVTHNGYKYIWRNTTSVSNASPGENSGWFRYSKEDGTARFEWAATNIYKYQHDLNGSIREIAYYKGKMYTWLGANNSNSINPPGEAREGWVEVSENFNAFNTYLQGEYVIHDGQLWRAKKNITWDLVHGNNVMPRGLNSFEYWEEVTIGSNPGRN